MLAQLADGNAVLVSTFVTAQITVGDIIYCLVVGEKADFDVFVGISWLRRYNTVADFSNDSMKIRGISGRKAALSMRPLLAPCPKV